MNKNIKTTFQSLEQLVGNTPLIGVKYRYKGKENVIYAKCEYYNFTGSIKDRMALHILKEAYKECILKPGDKIVEATSGNTGISFAAMGRMLGHDVSIIMPDWMSKERKLMIENFGAEVVPVSKKEGGFLESIRRSEAMAARDADVFLPCQFSNPHNVKAHSTTGNEIMTQLESRELRPDAFIAGVGTGGTIIGVGRALRSKYGNVKIHPLEPKESPTLSTGYKIGAHRIQGISDEFIPGIMKMDNTDEIVSVSDGDAILMAQKLATSVGLAVGISSGANIVGAIKLQEKYGNGSVVVTVLPDCNKKYLSTDLMKIEMEKEEYSAPKVELIGIDVLGK